MLEYEIIEGMPADSILEEIIRLQKQCFSNSELNFESLKRELSCKNNIITILARINSNFVGFKLGYERRLSQYYSWLGGVVPSARRKGIASQLMQQQHSLLRDRNYEVVRTQTSNEFKPMLILNFKNDFDIVGTYLNHKKVLRLILEKSL